jgi:hypothetical protein
MPCDPTSLHLDASLVIPTCVLRLEVSQCTRIPFPPAESSVLALWLNQGTSTILWWTAANPADSVQPPRQSHSWLGCHVISARCWFCGVNQPNPMCRLRLWAATMHRLHLGFEAQPRNCTRLRLAFLATMRTALDPVQPLGPSSQAYLSLHSSEATQAKTFLADSSPAPTQIKPQPTPAILGQESVHTMLSNTHHTKERPSTGPRTLRSSSSYDVCYLLVDWLCELWTDASIIVNRNAWPYLLSIADMYQVEKLKLHCASKMWDMASEDTVTSFIWWAIQANCTQLQDKCISLLERIFPHRILTYDWVVVCTDHPEFMHNLHRRLLTLLSLTTKVALMVTTPGMLMALTSITTGLTPLVTGLGNVFW